MAQLLTDIRVSLAIISDEAFCTFNFSFVLVKAKKKSKYNAVILKNRVKIQHRASLLFVCILGDLKNQALR